MVKQVECVDCLVDDVTTWRPITSGKLVRRCATHTRRRANEAKHRQKVRTRKNTYGISDEDAEELLAEQGGMCGICGPITGNRGVSRSLSTDHDHDCCSGKTSCGLCVRGFLCGTCNTYLGRIRDNVTVAERMVAYLHDPPWQKILRRRNEAV